MSEHSSRTWQFAEVVEAFDPAEGVRGLVLRPDRPYPVAPGAHIDIEVSHEGRQIRRSYSVVNSEKEGGLWTLSVQLARNSRGGSRAMHELVVGSRLRVAGPLQNFPLGVGASRYVLLAGGIGITALAAMATALRRRKADYQLNFVGRTRGVMAYLDQLVLEHGEHVTVHVDDEDTSLDVKALIDEVAGSSAASDTELYMCGPIGLMEAVKHEWTARGLALPNLRFETFANSGAWATEAFRVSIPALPLEVTVGTDVSLIDALEDAGVEVMWGCRKGECGLCSVRVLDCDGTIDHRDVFLSESQKTTDTTLCLCVSRVATGGDTTRSSELRTLTIDLP
ncbi:PDR/VanB family oxidoreductase [Rhodococcus sp. T2V]|uniref:PDR/VanB family oxidoreductase n=1 Tax=Rhodococcus sp. T2V TaxID=3034164 RepID=UPI0023E2A7EF|nr:PDR/VanB family oxidoreductase [Rhodococcus sp. T2V]MDF3311087.1 PDR/VanB family oxidoreductase [Rhodococcus sp. T2V]